MKEYHKPLHTTLCVFQVYQYWDADKTQNRWTACSLRTLRHKCNRNPSSPEYILFLIRRPLNAKTFLPLCQSHQSINCHQQTWRIFNSPWPFLASPGAVSAAKWPRVSTASVVQAMKTLSVLRAQAKVANLIFEEVANSCNFFKRQILTKSKF